LRVPDNLDKVMCMYCGHEVIIHDTTKLDVNLVYKVDIPKTLKLAQIAENAENYDDGYKYYSQIIESDAENVTAWLGRARCAAWKPGNNIQKLSEAIAYISTAKKLTNLPKNELVITIKSLLKATKAYIVTFFSLIESKQPTIDDGTKNGRRFEQDHFQFLYKSLNYCWSNLPTEKTADEIINLLVFLNERKAYHHSSYAPLLEKIERKYRGKTTILEEKKCFIATATMGDENHPYVTVLREYRDKVLRKDFFGRIFIIGYYKLSPPIAKIIERNGTLRKIIKFLVIKPIYLMANKIMHKPRKFD